MKRGILVTGGTRGIGKAFVTELLNDNRTRKLDNQHVFFTGRTVESCERAIANDSTWKNAHENGSLAYIPLAMDETCLADSQFWNNFQESLMSHVITKDSPITSLIHSAGSIGVKESLLVRQPASAIQSILNQHLISAIMLSKFIFKNHLKYSSRSDSSAILFISSIVGRLGNSGQCAYAAAKSGLFGLTKSLALEGASRNLRVNCLCPGLVNTDMTAHLQQDQEITKIPLGRMATTTEIAQIGIACLKNDYMTGQILDIDGGLSCGIR